MTVLFILPAVALSLAPFFPPRRCADDMALLRPLVLNDLFKMHHCNLDNFTQTFDVSYYLDYLAKWPHLCKAIENQSGQVEGYSKCPLAG